MDTPLTEYLQICESIARQSGAILVDYIGRFHVREKGRADLVTEADYASQENVVRTLAKIFPTHQILGEEQMPETLAQDSKGGYRWIVDPLDGTTNYVHGVPHFCVSLAMEYDGQLQVATIYAPLVDECYTAMRGGGAFLNGRPIHVSDAAQMSQSLVAIGFPPGAGWDSPDFLGFLNVMSCCQAIRRSGSTALNMAYVAAGRYDAAWNFHTNAWDMAAGALLVEEAGGTLRRTDGTPFDVNRNAFLATATEPLFEECCHRINDLDALQQTFRSTPWFRECPNT